MINVKVLSNFTGNFKLTFLFLIIFFIYSPAGIYGSFGENSIGINTHIPSADVIDACIDAGLKWIRVDNNWVDNQPNPGPPSFIFPLDDAVNYAVSRGLKIFMTIAYTPGWASSGSSDSASRNDVPLPGTYEPYVRESVAHYRAMGVTHFGLWNEPNLKDFFEGTAGQYVDLIVIPGIEAIRNGCADAGFNDCKALGPELAHGGDYDVYLQSVLERMDSAGVTFDIYTHHIYQGFEETGVHVWDGDRFFNALDQRRFFFTRRSFIDTLTDAGHAFMGVPDKEVWITETGYRCQPPMDGAQQHTQSIYYMRVIDEQLAREWYTISFFYEIADSFDELDGFGIIRRVSGPDSTWNDNFEFKEAYYALKERIASEPAFNNQSCEFQCCDGIDNDNDTLADMADSGCTENEDNDESDEPPPAKPEILVNYVDVSYIDGLLDEYDNSEFVNLTSPEDFVSPDNPPPPPSGLSCRFALKWKEDSLFLAVAVTDDVHDNQNEPSLIWMGDSIQVAFDTGLNGGHGYDGENDFEMGWARTDNGDVSYVWESPSGSSSFTGEFTVNITGTEVVYEIRIPAADIGISSFYEDMRLGFTLLVNDSDGAQRVGWIEWTPGIGAFKDPESFGMIVLKKILDEEPFGDENSPPIDFPDEFSPEFPFDFQQESDGDGPAGGKKGENCGCIMVF